MDETQQETQQETAETERRAVWLRELMWRLRGHQYNAEMIRDDTVLRVTSPRREDLTVDVRCEPRFEDGDRLWFFGPDDKPLHEADHITDTAVTIAGLLVARM